MTKAVLIKISSILIIVVALFVLCFVEDKIVTSALSVVNNYVYEIENAAKENGIVNGEVASLVDNLDYAWNMKESELCLMVNHKSIEQLGVEIVRLKTYIHEEEPIEFFVSLEIIKHYVEKFQHFMGAGFHNVL